MRNNMLAAGLPFEKVRANLQVLTPQSVSLQNDFPAAFPYHAPNTDANFLHQLRIVGGVFHARPRLAVQRVRCRRAARLLNKSSAIQRDHATRRRVSPLHSVRDAEDAYIVVPEVYLSRTHRPRRSHNREEVDNREFGFRICGTPHEKIPKRATQMPSPCAFTSRRVNERVRRGRAL